MAHARESTLTEAKLHPDRSRLPVPFSQALAVLLVAFVPASIAGSLLGGGLFAALGAIGLALAVRNPAGAWAAWRLSPAGPAIGMLLGVVNLAWAVAFGAKWRDLAWAPFMLAPFIAICFAAAGRGVIWYSRGAIVACWVALGLILYQTPRDEFDTSVGLLNVIIFGQLTVTAAIQALAFLHESSTVASSRTALWSALAGICAALLSGVRGAIVALPIALGVLWPARREWLAAVRRRPYRSLAGVLVAATAIVAVWSVSPLNARFARVGVEVSEVLAGKPAEGSVSLRLVQWRAAGEIIQAAPLTGVGPAGFKNALSQLQDRGLYPAGAPLFDHPHNTYLSVAARYGLPVLAGMLVAFVWVWRSLGSAPAPVAALGRSLLLAWAVMGIWNDLLSHQSSVRSLAFLLALLCWPADRTRPGRFADA